MTKRATVLVLATALATLVTVTVAVAASDRQSAGVNWHPQQASQGHTGSVDGAAAKLVRNDNGISYELTTNSLAPGNAYTLWVVVVNNPEACDPSPCTGPDIFNSATNSQVLYGTGHVAGGSGKGTFAGSLREGPLDGWLPGRGFDDSGTAEIHLVLNDHGPKLADFMSGMIKTYRGGCSDSSPFPGIFPPSALADGEVGLNICRLYQSAIFTAP